jgi:hypothetical protein
MLVSEIDRLMQHPCLWNWQLGIRSLIRSLVDVWVLGIFRSAMRFKYRAR